MDKYYDADIYVDGSYNQTTKSYAYGMVVHDKTGDHYFSKAFPPDDKSSMRNVAGEIAGAQAGMQYALDTGCKNVRILYDYAGIESWCNGSWRAKNAATQGYKQFYDDAASKMNIDFVHVKGHTGVEDNEICDALAKAALDLPDTPARRNMYKNELASAQPYISLAERQSKISKFSNIDAPEVTEYDSSGYQR